MADRVRVRAEEPHTSGVAAAARSGKTKGRSVLSILVLGSTVYSLKAVC